MSDRERRRIDGRQLEVKNLDKVFFPDDGIRKGQLVDYYERIADHLLPHVRQRPLVVQRFPDGIGSSGFYQKNTPDHAPSWITRVEIATVDGGSTRYPVVDSAAGLVYFVDQGAVVFHSLLARADAPDRPLEVIFDLDPSTDDLEPVRRAARELRIVLDELGLAPRVKSSGSRGLHVVVDVADPEPDYELTSAFAHRVAATILDRGPFTLAHRKRDRGDRLFLDVLRNGPANHAVAPWSVRARPGAPVAAPLDWDEALASSFDPGAVTMTNAFRRLGQKTDPWSDPPRPASTITDALAALDDDGAPGTTPTG